MTGVVAAWRGSGPGSGVGPPAVGPPAVGPPAVGPPAVGPPAPGPGGARPAPTEPAPHPADAAALAAAFGVDYLSWDEDDPDRRGRVLLDYLRAPGHDPAHLGWSGEGRQRAELALIGRVRPDGDGRVLVDVRVRVTPYRSVGEHGPAQPEPDATGTPATAPAPTGRGWRSLPSSWIRLGVPVTFDGDRLVVDAWEEALDERPAPPPAPEPAITADDHALADDDPLADPLADPPAEPPAEPRPEPVSDPLARSAW